VKAKVYVTLKTGVLDPQGKAIQHSVELLGFEGIRDIRQGKYFEVMIEAENRKSAQEAADRLAREVLSNPVIEDYRVEVED
jgi:phosphoribosylformylglycinamidine synthase subunit PurS